MAIKDLFVESIKSLSKTSISELTHSVESADYVREYIADKDRFIPQVDFTNPSNFAKFGSAEKYYLDSIAHIYNDYPFDGSLKERYSYFNSSSYLDRYIFEKEYPRFNGYVKFSPNGWGVNNGFSGYNLGNPVTIEYIKIFGTMNTGSEGGYDGANVYDTGSYRATNLKLDGNYGNAIEFWLKKGAIVAAKTEKEVVFDLWNGETVSHAVGSQYGRFLVYLSNDTGDSTPSVRLTYVSGTISGMTNINIGNAICDDTWNHYAICVLNSSTSVNVDYYINGVLSGSTVTAASAINEVTGAMIGYIGAIQTAVDTIEAPPSANGYGKLSGSIDEFRYWKRFRTAQDIGRYWFTQVGGGSNTVDGNTSLGVYYKFNEGIVGDTSYDARVLDYSGRLSHGYFYGYDSDHRSTDSAIVDSDASGFEYKDPTVYSNHSDVVSLISEKSETGSYYDRNNSTCLYHSLPAWVIEEDEERETYNVKNLTQIMGQYFDSLYLQISASVGLGDINYDGLSGSNKPYPFVDRMLASKGFSAPEIFADASVLSQLASRDEKREFENKLYDVKNFIYQNIYNNLSFIYKSKGSMESIRNLIRCFGVDDELIKVNLYSNNSTFTLENNYKSVSVKKKCVDFNNVDRFYGTVYQYTASSNADSLSYITSSGNSLEASGSALTLEADVLFPKKFSGNSNFYFETPFITSSLFGIHTVPQGATSAIPIYDTTWGSPDSASLQVYALREELESKNVKFVLTGSSGGYVPLLTSSFYANVYDNEKWTFAVKIKHERYPYYNELSGTHPNNFVVEFYGVNTLLDRVLNEFNVTGTMTHAQGVAFMNNAKRFYVGSHRTNFTGSLLSATDVRIYSARVWLDYLEDSEVKSHAMDIGNYGVLNPYRNITLSKDCYRNQEIPKIDSLALYWDFETVTGSDANGRFLVEDLSSGSNSILGRYNWFSGITKKQLMGRGEHFLESDSEVIDVDYLFSAKQKLPETLDHDGMIEILERDDETFTRESKPIKYFFSVEKSMYQIISEEMLNWFATIVDFNNLIGMPVNRYRMEYKDLGKLRQLFFERVGNTPDVEKFLDYYKWFDGAIVKMLHQLIPASANFSENIENMIESHVLERNKYWTKFPTLEFKTTDPEDGIRGINELKYDWNHGHHPISNNQNENCFHWKTKELRTDRFLSSSVHGVNTTKTSIQDIALTTFNRELSTPYGISSGENKEIKGGANFNRNKRSFEFIKTVTKNPNAYLHICSSSLVLKDCLDGSDNTSIKKEYNAKVTLPLSQELFKSDMVLPFNLVSSSVKLGYNSLIPDLNIANYHQDFYIDGGETPMQGPFTEKHVGGYHYRHNVVNSGAIDTNLSRKEGFKLYRNSTTGDLTIYNPATTAAGVSSIHVRKGEMSRGEIAKRPVNIANIKGANYNKTWEYVQTSGRKINNKAFVLSGGFGEIDIISSTYVTGIMDYAKPSRGRHESVFVERFSAPGGPETSGDANGGVGLDSISGEYSVYNSYNFRNLRVRDSLRTLLTRHCGQFGTDSVYGSVNASDYHSSASFHKAPRNTFKRMSLVDESVGPVTASKYDNWFIQRCIPAMDTGYYWINQSVTGTGIFGYAAASDSFLFASSSFGIPGSVYTASFAGYASASFVTSSQELNLILNSREGTYGWPSWKQIRTGEKQVARYKRNRSIVEYLNPSQPQTVVKNGTREMISPLRSYNVSSYRESPLSSKYANIEHRLTIDNDGQKSSLLMKSPFGNALSTFANKELSNKLNMVKVDNQFYDRALQLYNSKEKLGKTNGVQSFDSIKYIETIFPSDANTFLKEARERETFSVEYWNSSRQLRNEVGLNSQGFTVSQSIWPLDARNDFTSSLSVTGGLGYEGQLQNKYTTFFRTGPSSEFVEENFAQNLKVAPLYCRPTIEFDSPVRQMGTSGSRIIAGDTEWTVAKESGKIPFYDSYSNFNIVSRLAGQNYSVVPEFRISECMEYYVKQCNGNFLAPKLDFLTLTGAAISSSQEENFYKTYSNGDFLEYFQVVVNDHKDISDCKQISISCDGILNLLPYDGFFPVSRTLQLAQLFSQSYGDYVYPSSYTSSYVDVESSKWRAFFAPFFAPGILYNSIKSGMAVDYPIYSDTAPDSTDDWNFGLTGSDTYGSGEPAPFYDASTRYTKALKGNFSQRLPFESLVEPENYISKTRVWDSEPDLSASSRIYLSNPSSSQSAMWSGKGDDLYKMAMHNFLAEVPNFFLEEGKFTTFSSKEIPYDGIFIPQEDSNKFFGMDIYVSNSECKNLTDWNKRKDSAKYLDFSKDYKYVVSSGTLSEIKGMHTQMYSRDSAFGPPWVHDHALFTTGSSTGSIYGFHYGYEPYTPAYFNGFGLIRLLFYPFKGSGKYTLSDIQENLTASYIRMPTEKTGSGGIVATDLLLEWQTLCAMDQNVFLTSSDGSSGPLSYFSENISAGVSNWQQLSSSVNFLGKTKIAQPSYELKNNKYVPSSVQKTNEYAESWTIQPKWETPILNFYNKSVDLPLYGSGSIAKGMWHQYGDIPVSDSIVMGIGDIPNVVLSSSYFNRVEADFNPYGRFLVQNFRENFVQLKKVPAKLEVYFLNNEYLKPPIIGGGANNSWNVYLSSSSPASRGAFRSSYDVAPLLDRTYYQDNYSNALLLSGADGLKTSVSYAFPEEITSLVGSNFITSSTPAKVSYEILDEYAYNGLALVPEFYRYPDYYASGDLGKYVKVQISRVYEPDGSQKSGTFCIAHGLLEDGSIGFGYTASFYGGETRNYEVKSLADLVGFSKTRKKLGNVREEKSIKESIVAIPYVEKNNKKCFYEIKREKVEDVINNEYSKDDIGDSVVDMVTKMQQYVFPPTFDFITNKSITPFALYIFEFSHDFTKRDLYDIWQGVIDTFPVSKQTSTIAHSFDEKEIIGKEFDPATKWLVFKVKQKANWNYFAMTADSSDDDRFKFDFSVGRGDSSIKSIPRYSYNWPYDFCSLVELAKIGVEIDIEGKKK